MVARAVWPGASLAVALAIRAVAVVVAVVVALAVAVALTGCAGGRRDEVAPTRTRAVAPGARALRRPVPEPVARPAESSAAPVVRRFATLYINWSWRDVAADMAALALQSVGQARSELAMAAAQTDADTTLRQAQIANAGTVEAVAPLAGQAQKWVVVTREVTTAARSAAYEGLSPAWHVAIATVERSRSGAWVLSGWQPES